MLKIGKDRMRYRLNGKNKEIFRMKLKFRK
jgi:hypothetical protein